MITLAKDKQKGIFIMRTSNILDLAIFSEYSYYTHTAVSVIYTSLLKLKQTPIEDRINKGICIICEAYCVNVDYYLVTFSLSPSTINFLLCDAISNWPEIYEDENGKSTTYPVEGSFDRYKHELYNYKIWQNPKRIRLLDYLISYFQDYLLQSKIYLSL